MKNNKKKSILLLITIAALLLAAVGGTVAYLVTSTDPVVNTFTPANVKTEIDEEFNGSVKSEIIINNTGNIPVYVRVAVVGNWVKDGKVVDSWTPSFTVGSGWDEGGDGYYYYTKPVEAKVGDTPGVTTDLLGSSIEAAPRADGSILEVTVIQQSIQAEPVSVVVNAWGVNANNGTISK